MLDTVLGKLSRMFGPTWTFESAFSMASFMKSKYRSGISGENLGV